MFLIIYFCMSLLSLIYYFEVNEQNQLFVVFLGRIFSHVEMCGFGV